MNCKILLSFFCISFFPLAYAMDDVKIGVHDWQTLNQFHDAIRNGRQDEVKRMLAAGVNPDGVADTLLKSKHTSLMTAAQFNQPEIARILFATGKISLNAVDGCGMTALHHAVISSYDVTKLLIEKGINVDVIDNENRTALHIACGCGNEIMIRRLLEVPIDLNKVDRNGLTPLLVAALKGKAEVIRLLLSKQDIKKTVTSGKYNTSLCPARASALSLAARGGHLAAVRELLTDAEICQTINDADGNWTTPLMEACKRCDFRIVELILRFDSIDLNKRDSFGNSGLDLASVRGDVDSTKLIIQKLRADPSVAPEERLTRWTNVVVPHLEGALAKTNPMSDTALILRTELSSGFHAH